jgi:hypothetical protein
MMPSVLFGYEVTPEILWAILITSVTIVLGSVWLLRGRPTRTFSGQPVAVLVSIGTANPPSHGDQEFFNEM